jgi:hypothetical protein
VAPRQGAGVFSVFAGDREQIEAIRSDRAAYRSVKSEPPGGSFDRDFPNRCHADENLGSLVSDRVGQRR